ncbi:MAG: hypothetical protein GQ581_00010 [Methyloprofundus sp.]|nr:hypothetical protein [Methyloprofundus sp.]
MKNRILCILLAYGIGFLSCNDALADLNESLIAYYPFNGNAHEESGKGHHGVVDGATLTAGRFGHPNSAYEFDGVNDGLLATVDQALLGREFTFSAWVKYIPDINDGYSLIGLYYPTEAARELRLNTVVDLSISTSSKHLAVSTGVSSVFGAHGSIELLGEVWNHIILRVDEQGITLFVNGIQDPARTTPKGGVIIYESSLNYLDLQIGYTDLGSVNAFLNGTIDDVMLFNRAISESEIQKLYQNEFTFIPGGNLTCDASITVEGVMNIPCIAVLNVEGETDYYQASMALVASSPFMFELIDVNQINGGSINASNCLAALDSSGVLNIPCVLVPNASGSNDVFEASLKFLPQTSPVVFELIDARLKN